MASRIPKQYLPLAGRTVIEWSLAPFLAEPSVAGIVVVLGQADTHWPQLAVSRDARIVLAPGGQERMYSVLSGLIRLKDTAESGDWVLVHDAARPCLHRTDLKRLLASAAPGFAGGLLAAPVVDTLKRADDEGCVRDTLSRTGIWRAFTPQMFPYAELRDALERAVDEQWTVTDEASAMEQVGGRPHLVPGRADNIKITSPADLVMAEAIHRSWAQRGEH